MKVGKTDKSFSGVFKPTVEGIAEWLSSENILNFASALSELAVRQAAKEDAEVDTNHPAVQRFLSDRISSTEPLTDDEKNLIAKSLDPTHKAILGKNFVRREYDKIERPGSVAGLLVYLCVATGVQPFRNEASPEHSACDIVAEGLRRANLKPTSCSGVKAEFLAFRKSVDITWHRDPKTGNPAVD